MKRALFLLLLALSPCADVVAQAGTQDPARLSLYAAQTLARRQDWWFSELPQWALVINVLAACLLLVVARRQRQDTLLPWLLGIAVTGNGGLLATLSSAALPPLIVQVSFLGWGYCLLRLMLPAPGRRVMSGLVLGFPVALLSFGIAQRWLPAHGPAALTALACAGLAVAALILRPRAPQLPMGIFLGITLLAAAGLLDSLALIGGWRLAAFPEKIPASMPLAQMVWTGIVLSFLVSRHVQNQRDLQLLNASLDQRVHAAEAELESRLRMAARDALDAAAIGERSTIYRSLHEDLSDKLLQLIYSASKPETADLARAALAELRDTHNLQASQQGQVSALVADILSEAQSRCEHSAMALEWQIDPALEQLSVSARQQSAVSRTVREAISNLFKHAQARRVRLEFSAHTRTPAVLEYRVIDDGVGFAPQHCSGRGLVNMQQRLEELGGSLEIDSTPGKGSCLAFRLPLCGESA